jgi:antitoxin (DNA-binding transcriptional repressor) of toxin-antitoxin stability system
MLFRRSVASLKPQYRYPSWSRLTSFDNVATRGYILVVKTVGIRELKNRLSEHLREVRRGEHLLITDRGEVIGELSPPGQSIAETSVPIGVLALARRGMLTLGNPGDRSSYPALPRLRRGKHDAASMLDAERGRR